jgi:hypothetical protein
MPIQPNIAIVDMVIFFCLDPNLEREKEVILYVHLMGKRRRTKTSDSNMTNTTAAATTVFFFLLFLLLFLF